VIGEWVFVNGEFVPKDRATVSVFDHGFVYGDGVFEGIAVTGRSIFKLGQHVQRLMDSAAYLAIAPCRSAQDIAQAAIETARRNGIVDGYLRVLLTRGAGPVGIRNMDQLGPPTLVVIAQHEDRGRRAGVYANGLKATISAVRRVPSDCIDAKAKTCNYVNNILAYLQARHAGADTAVMLDTGGSVAECHAANVFCVSRGVVRTPALGAILNGITRQTVIPLCAGLGIDCEETRLTPHDLFCADEVFETGSLAEIKPIVSIDGRLIGAGKPGPVTRRIHAALRGLMESGAEGTPCA
jgi:branched-chain amino acid aminotransferase